MKKLHLALLLLLTLITVGCSTSIKTTLADRSLTSLAPTADVVVIGPEDALPAGAKLIGKVKVGDSGFTTDCGYNTVVNQAKAEARKAGGNAIKLTSVKKPNALTSTCYRIEANILSLSNMESFKQRANAEQDSITKTKFPENPNYALLYVYRRGSANGALLNYTIHLDGKPLFKLYNNSKQVVKVYEEGLHKVRASLETEEIKEVDIKFGEEYFLECGINSGVIIGRPELNFVDKKIGREEYEKVGD